MFTGLVEAMGTVRELGRTGGLTRIGIESPLLAPEMAAGESVSVDGACLTVTRISGELFYADVIPETLDRTTLGGLRSGSRVNLERALRLGDRLGGHLVQGHVDAVAHVAGVARRGGDHRLRVGLPTAIARFVAEKGSIALNGVSLTVASVARGSFEVALIPETLEHTNLGRARPGQPINVEVDLVARYLERLMSPTPEDGRPIRPGAGRRSKGR